MSYRGLPIYENSAIITRRELAGVNRIGSHGESDSDYPDIETNDYTNKHLNTSNKRSSLRATLLTCKEYIFTSIYVIVLRFYHLFGNRLTLLMSQRSKVEEAVSDSDEGADGFDDVEIISQSDYNSDAATESYRETDNNSLEILEENKIEPNIFSSLLQVNDDNEISITHDQYGTSLSTMLSSNYSTSSSNFAISSRKNDNKSLEANPFSNAEMNDKLEYNKVVLKYYLPNKPISALNYSIVDTLLSNFHIDKISDIYENERKKIQDHFKQEREKEKAGITELSNSQLSKVLNIWKSKSNTLVVSNFQIDIFVRDLKTLDDRQWLNDNIIDYYFNLITLDNDQVYGWTTHFFTTLQSKGYQGVSRWAKRRKIDVTKRGIILVPINIMSTHWALAVVNNSEKSFSYYDSLTSSGNITALEILKDYMINEGKRLNSKVDFQSYQLNPNMKTPQQKNGFDCGVFTCTCAKYISNSLPLTYGQNDMKVIRRRMAYEIIQKKLLS